MAQPYIRENRRLFRCNGASVCDLILSNGNFLVFNRLTKSFHLPAHMAAILLTTRSFTVVSKLFCDDMAQDPTGAKCTHTHLTS